MEPKHVLILEILDLKERYPGGIDTAIHGVLKYSPNKFTIVGVTADKSAVGRIQTVEMYGKHIKFIPILYLNRFKRRRLPDSIKFGFAVIRKRRQIKSVLADVLQLHRLEIGIFAVCFLGRKIRVQCIHNNVALYNRDNSESYWRYFRLIYLALERIFIPQMDKTLVFNAGAAERLQKVSPNTIYCTTWFDSDLFRPQPQRESDRKQVLFVGRLELQKNPLLFIEVVHELKKIASYPFTATIVGNGKLLDACMRRVHELKLSEFVEFIDKLDPIELAHEMRKANVMVMTSSYEGSPRVLYEAGACGLPVVCTIHSDPDFWLDGRNGFAVIDISPNQLAKKSLEAMLLNRQYCSIKASVKSASTMVPCIFDYHALIE